MYVLYVFMISWCIPLKLDTYLIIFFTIPVTVASGELSFSKQTYLCSSIIDDRLLSSVILSIGNDLAQKIN